MKKSIAISLLLSLISVNSIFAGEIEWENSLGKEIDRNVGYAGPEEFTNLMQKVLKK